MEQLISVNCWFNFYLSLLFTHYCLIIQYLSAYFIIKLKIDVIVGMGGYLSIPVILAGRILGKKTIIQEQNFYPGIANKKLNILATKTAVGFEESKQYFLKKTGTVFCVKQ